MKFEYKIIDSFSLFTAIPENEDENNGLRAQGPYTPIKLINNTLKINYVSKKNLHPDIIAAICLTAFYPFIKFSATMPLPVSQVFADNLSLDILPQHIMIDGVYKAFKAITITNINKDLKIYYDKKNTVISYGGGMDSTSLALLFPNFPLIHSSNLNVKAENKNIMKNFITKNLQNESYIIESNCTELCKPGGFTTFTNIFLIPLILSEDLNIKNICCGEILGSSCLSNGKKYFPQFDPKRRNRWLKFYEKIGLNIFSPIAGCSELITSNILYKNNLSNDVLYCEANNGSKCYKCSKCLRKLLELNYHGFEYDLNTFDKTYVTNFLKNRPLYFSHIFIETIKNSLNTPIYMKETINDIINIKTDLFNKIYSKSFIYFPNDIKDEIITELTKYAQIMSKEEEEYLEQWNMN